jgi:cytochrome d ubiquinol oxidase subunit I
MRIFALNFAMGGDGIPMEFQFGTTKFSELTGGIIGQTLAMEACFPSF